MVRSSARSTSARFGRPSHVDSRRGVHRTALGAVLVFLMAALAGEGTANAVPMSPKAGMAVPTTSAAPSAVCPKRTPRATVFGLSAPSESALRSVERRLGVRAGVQGVFVDFTQPFPQAAAEDATARGAVLLVSWEPWNSAIGGARQSSYALTRIAAGSFDRYIATFAQAAAAAGEPVFVRWAPEMNGDWLPWSPGVNGNSAGDYIAAWRHVVDVSRAVGATNIRWVFNPIVSYEGSHPLASLYPGTEYVDWIALDGHNWGHLKARGWQSFTDIFTMGLSELTTVAPCKPLAITEIGSVPGSGKPAWITESMAQAQAVGARMLVWFNYNKESDWRLDSDPASTLAARNSLASGWVVGGSVQTVRTALGV